MQSPFIDAYALGTYPHFIDIEESNDPITAPSDA